MSERPTITLECGHSVTWGENCEQATADRPWEGRVVYCPECESDQKITEVDPTQFTIERIVLAGHDDEHLDTRTTDRARIFFDAITGSYGYELFGVADGLFYDGEEHTHIDSIEAAERAARHDYNQQQESLDDIDSDEVRS